MITRVVSAELAQKVLTRHLVHREPWNVHLGHGTSALFEYGERQRPPGGRRESGTVHLWIAASAWRVEDDVSIHAGSADTGGAMHSALSRLSGCLTTSIRLQPPGFDLILFFGDASLRFVSFKDGTEDDAFRFYTPEEILFRGPDGQFFLQDRDDSSDSSSG